MQATAHRPPHVRQIDSLIYGYLRRSKYSKTLECFWAESEYLKTLEGNVVPGKVIVQVNDLVFDRNLEQIIEAFLSVGRFDLPPELVDFGVRLRELANDFSTLTSVDVNNTYVDSLQKRLYGRRGRATKSSFTRGSNSQTRADTQAYSSQSQTQPYTSDNGIPSQQGHHFGAQQDGQDGSYAISANVYTEPYGYPGYPTYAGGVYHGQQQQMQNNSLQQDFNFSSAPCDDAGLLNTSKGDGGVRRKSMPPQQHPCGKPIVVRQFLDEAVRIANQSIHNKDNAEHSSASTVSVLSAIDDHTMTLLHEAMPHLEEDMFFGDIPPLDMGSGSNLLDFPGSGDLRAPSSLSSNLMVPMREVDADTPMEHDANSPQVEHERYVTASSAPSCGPSSSTAAESRSPVNAAPSSQEKIRKPPARPHRGSTGEKLPKRKPLFDPSTQLLAVPAVQVFASNVAAPVLPVPVANSPTRDVSKNADISSEGNEEDQFETDLDKIQPSVENQREQRAETPIEVDTSGEEGAEEQEFEGDLGAPLVSEQPLATLSSRREEEAAPEPGDEDEIRDEIENRDGRRSDNPSCSQSADEQKSGERFKPPDKHDRSKRDEATKRAALMDSPTSSESSDVEGNSRARTKDTGRKRADSDRRIDDLFGEDTARPSSRDSDSSRVSSRDRDREAERRRRDMERERLRDREREKKKREKDHKERGGKQTDDRRTRHEHDMKERDEDPRRKGASSSKLDRDVRRHDESRSKDKDREGDRDRGRDREKKDPTEERRRKRQEEEQKIKRIMEQQKEDDLKKEEERRKKAAESEKKKADEKKRREEDARRRAEAMTKKKEDEKRKQEEQRKKAEEKQREEEQRKNAEEKQRETEREKAENAERERSEAEVREKQRARNVNFAKALQQDTSSSEQASGRSVEKERPTSREKFTGEHVEDPLEKITNELDQMNKSADDGELSDTELSHILPIRSVSDSALEKEKVLKPSHSPSAHFLSVSQKSSSSSSPKNPNSSPRGVSRRPVDEPPLFSNPHHVPGGAPAPQIQVREIPRISNGVDRKRENQLPVSKINVYKLGMVLAKMGDKRRKMFQGAQAEQQGGREREKEKPERSREHVEESTRDPRRDQITQDPSASSAESSHSDPRLSRMAPMKRPPFEPAPKSVVKSALSSFVGGYTSEDDSDATGQSPLPPATPPRGKKMKLDEAEIDKLFE